MTGQLVLDGWCPDGGVWTRNLSISTIPAMALIIHTVNLGLLGPLRVCGPGAVTCFALLVTQPCFHIIAIFPSLPSDLPNQVQLKIKHRLAQGIFVAPVSLLPGSFRGKGPLNSKSAHAGQNTG